MNHKLSHDFKENSKLLDEMLRINESFDLIGREIKIASRPAKMYFIDAFIKDEILEKMLEFLTKLTDAQVDGAENTRDFCSKYITYTETDVETNTDHVVTGVLSGTLALIIEGFNHVIMIDARTYPTRSLEEPDDDKVLRGSHDGFTETIVFNTELVRRRLRDPNLTMYATKAGTKSKTDIVLCYLDNLADKQLVKKLKDKISNIQINALTMSQESLVECLLPKQWYNPFPKVRYTERPDVATACVAEGNIVIMVDNSPSAIIVETSFFDFLQNSNDFYFPTMIGTYLRFVRLFVSVLTLILTPVWFLLVKNPETIPAWLDFIKIEEPNSLPIIVQLLVVELVIDALKLASLNTPSALSNSFSVIGALVLGEFAIKANWFVSEVVLYMAFVAIANYAQPSFELGYAFKFSRILLLVLTAVFNYWGFIAGMLLIIIQISTTKTLSSRSYLYPVIPFNKKAFVSLFIRKPINKSKT